jgi:hypothetical protein
LGHIELPGLGFQAAHEVGEWLLGPCAKVLDQIGGHF